VRNTRGHGLQEIRYEHSFQVGHTTTVVAAAAAAQPSAGNATEATAMSAAMVVVQLLMVLVVKLLLLLLLMVMLLQQLSGMRITRGGISSRLCRDKRVDRQDGRETGLGPARRRRSGRQSWCCGAHLEPVVLLVILCRLWVLVVPVVQMVLWLRLVVPGSSGGRPLVRDSTADGRSVGRGWRDVFTTAATAARPVNGRREILEIVVGRCRGRAHAPGGQRGVPSLFVAVVAVVPPVTSVVRRIVLIVGRRFCGRYLLGPVCPTPFVVHGRVPATVAAATTCLVVFVVVLGVQLFAELLQVLRQSVVRRSNATDYDSDARHDRLVVQAVGRRRVVRHRFAVVRRRR